MSLFVEGGMDAVDFGEDGVINIRRRMGVGDYDHIDWLCENAGIGRTLALLEANIVDWTLKEDGKDIPLSRENIARLDYEKATRLILEIGKRNARIPKKA